MEEYYIKSYWLASYLKSIGIDPVRIEMSPDNKRLFYYEDRETVRQHINYFHNNEQLQSFIDACVKTKHEMINARRKADK